MRRRCQQGFELFLASIDQRNIGIVLTRQRCKLIDRDVVFSAGSAEGEEPLLNTFEFGRIEVGGAQSRFEMVSGFVQCGQRRIERFYGRLNEAWGLRGAPFQPPDHARQRGHGGIGAGDHIVGVAQVFGHFLRLHH